MLKTHAGNHSVLLSITAQLSKMVSRKWLMSNVGRAAPVLSTLQAGRWFNASWAERLQAALFEVAFVGLYGTKCNVDKAAPLENRCRGECLRRVAKLVSFASDATLDRLLWKQLNSLSSTPEALDSIQLFQQPQGAGAVRWTTELWDVRQLYQLAQTSSPTKSLGAPAGDVPADNATADLVTVGLSWPNGTRCQQSKNYKKCYACKGSRLEHRCHVRDMQAWCNTAYGRWRTLMRGNRSCGTAIPWPGHDRTDTHEVASKGPSDRRVA